MCVWCWTAPPHWPGPHTRCRWSKAASGGAFSTNTWTSCVHTWTCGSFRTEQVQLWTNRNFWSDVLDNGFCVCESNCQTQRSFFVWAKLFLTEAPRLDVEHPRLCELRSFCSLGPYVWVWVWLVPTSTVCTYMSSLSTDIHSYLLQRFSTVSVLWDVQFTDRLSRVRHVSSDHRWVQILPWWLSIHCIHFCLKSRFNVHTPRQMRSLRERRTCPPSESHSWWWTSQFWDKEDHTCMCALPTATNVMFLCANKDTQTHTCVCQMNSCTSNPSPPICLRAQRSSKEFSQWAQIPLLSWCEHEHFTVRHLRFYASLLYSRVQDRRYESVILTHSLSSFGKTET